MTDQEDFQSSYDMDALFEEQEAAFDATAKAFNSLIALVDEQRETIRDLTDENAQLVQNNQRYALLRMLAPHLLYTVANSARFNKDFHLLVEQAFTTEKLEQSIDTLIESGPQFIADIIASYRK